MDMTALRALMLRGGGSGGGGGGAMKMGVIRPDAELVEQYTYDKLLVTDGIVGTLPAYSTNDNSIVASAQIGTVSVDMDYDYFVQQRTLTIPIYSTDTFGNGRQEYDICSACAEIVIVPANTITAISDDTIKYATGRTDVKTAFNWLLVYGYNGAVYVNQQTTINNFGFGPS